ncbi:MAG TPA: hypothetical protein VN231_06115 [Allosphingosinicella sp.]|nr:hypothetical protein [Allosphingosinicella sp.]
MSNEPRAPVATPKSPVPGSAPGMAESHVEACGRCGADHGAPHLRDCPLR